jgi:integrative and conjugative element protein (TIGR02256 family)
MRTRVLVHHTVCKALDLAAAGCAAIPEAGGILLGAYRGMDMEVTGRTDPGPEDERRLFSFTRADPYHDAANRQAWNASGGTVSYIGEWHTHPYGGVKPSSTDTTTWRSEAKRCGRPMVFALVVPGAWGLFLVRPRWLRPEISRLALVETGNVGEVHA